MPSSLSRVPWIEYLCLSYNAENGPRPMTAEDRKRFAAQGHDLGNTGLRGKVLHHPRPCFKHVSWSFSDRRKGFGAPPLVGGWLEIVEA